jgi:hypothetical protein
MPCHVFYSIVHFSPGRMVHDGTLASTANHLVMRCLLASLLVLRTVCMYMERAWLIDWQKQNYRTMHPSTLDPRRPDSRVELNRIESNSSCHVGRRLRLPLACASAFVSCRTVFLISFSSKSRRSIHIFRLIPIRQRLLPQSPPNIVSE